jgi:predicted glycosyltransferase
MADKIWIDLDNSPHVPFFAPIIAELRDRGYQVLLTGRDCSQTRELIGLFGLECRIIGRHVGKNRLLKLAGLLARASQLAPTAIRERPILAVSHGSRSQLLAASALRIPAMFIGDYEFSTTSAGVHPRWFVCPEVIPASSVTTNGTQVLKYPGIKEDVYVPGFVPDGSLRRQLGLAADDLVVTVRPPATDAHYHNPESTHLFEVVMDIVRARADVRVVLLPRNERQGSWLRERWPDLFASGRVRIPESVVDGLNLIWYSDLVVSGGGTMNREAAALGVPVYSIFRGKTGAVDRYLSDTGRLVMLESADDVRIRMPLVRRTRPAAPAGGSRAALAAIVDHITAAATAIQKRALRVQPLPSGNL